MIARDCGEMRGSVLSLLLATWAHCDAAQLGCSPAVAECAAELARGGVYGYVGLGAVYVALDITGKIIGTAAGVVRPSRGERVEIDGGEGVVSDLSSVAGRWVLDAARSESLEPFLIAVGAPKLVAKLVGSKGKPMAIAVEGGGGVTVSIQGKPAETFSTRKPTAVETPRGTVTATLRASGGPTWRAFTVSKAGPSKGESSQEERELIEGGRTLRCRFTHTTSSGVVTSVVRYYTREV